MKLEASDDSVPSEETLRAFFWNSSKDELIGSLKARYGAGVARVSGGVTRILSENGIWVMTGSSPVCLTARLPNPYQIKDAEGRGTESIEEAEILGWAAQIQGPWCIEWMGTTGTIQRKHWSK